MLNPAAIRVLLIEPDPDTRELYEIGLTMAGMDVRSAPDAASATVAFAQHSPVILVSETRLPDRSKMTSLTRLSNAARVPVIAITTLPQYQHHAFRDWDVATVLMKPCGPHDLASAIRAALSLPPQ
jgi:DNA-binding response OmpR family regulator